jgi:membrane-bound serine protease (ClpP class)
VGDTVVLSSYTLQIQPVNWAGTALILLAFVFLAVDLVVTNHGLPTVGAVVALVLGISTLFDATGTYSLVSLVVLVSLSILIGVFFTGSWSEARVARRRPASTGLEGWRCTASCGGPPSPSLPKISTSRTASKR